MKMSPEVRTALRKILRDHSGITKFVEKKSDVNNLSRDELIALADRLEIDFIYQLQKAVPYKVLFSFESSLEQDANFKSPFDSELTFDLSLNALGTHQTLKVKVEYEFIPDWQFACLEEKRLKYRRGSSSSTVHIEVIDEEYRANGEVIEHREWIEGGEVLWDILKGPIDKMIFDRIDDNAWKQDQVNREKLGFPPGDRARSFPPTCP